MVKKNDNVFSLHDKRLEKKIDSLNEEIESLEKKRKETCEMAVKTVLRALNCKDDYTYGHSMRVAFYSVALGKELGLSKDELYKLELAALFHDIGKIGVPDEILMKPSRLEEEEFHIMKQHPTKSAEILADFDYFADIADWVKFHHERYDGRGYPDGLKGEDIPLYSRIILIGDTFDAMTSTRPYRKGLSYEIAFSELDEFSGTQFDPKLVKAFVKAMTKEEAKKEETFKLTIIEGPHKKDAA